MISLSVENLSKCYYLGKKRRRELWAIKDVSFEVESGKILGIIGPNGAGKTTLLRVLARITKPTRGRATGRGRLLPLLALGSGFQPTLGTRENIFLNAAMYGIPASDVKNRFDEIVEFAGIKNYLDRPLKHCPSGMYLRLAFSVAVTLDPDIILADEVLAVGDIEFQERCMQKVEEAGKGGVAVLFVSHNMAEITRLCDEVMWINLGEVVTIGDPEEVVAAYQNAAWCVDDRNPEEATGSHVGEYGRILFAKPTSSNGREIGAVRLSEPAAIEVAFVVMRPGVSVRCAVDFHVAGRPAFRTVQPQATHVDRPGIYKASVSIPPHLLTEGVYSVDAIVSIGDGDVQCAPLRMFHAISFQVYDVNEAESARGTFGGKIPGVVRPRLEWDVSKEG